MDDKLVPLLEKLAEKFGTTVEHLWEVMIKQASISAIIDTITTVVIVGICVAGYRLVRRKTTKHPREEYHSPAAEWEDDGALAAWACLIVACLVAGAVSIFAIDNVVTALFNPEYWALIRIRG
jgi:hypothetical protein